MKIGDLLKKINIIKSNNEFALIMKKGKAYKEKNFIIFLYDKKEKYYRIGIAVQKKIGNAVVRNKIKRQIKEIITKNSIALTNNDCIILVRKEILNIDYKTIEEKLLKLINIVYEDNKNENKI